MKGKVTADKLNVRRLPGRTGEKIGVLHFNAIIEIIEELEEWLRIKFKGGFGFVHSDYVMTLPPAKKVKGKVAVNRLNVRSEPDIHSVILGTLNRNTIIQINVEHGDWLEIPFNGAQAFLHKDFVKIIEIEKQKQGLVKANELNVRKQPSLTGEKAGSLRKNSTVNIDSQVGDWYEIRFNDSAAFVFAKHIKIIGDLGTDSGPTTVTEFLFQRTDLQNTKLAPTKLFNPTDSAIDQQVARTWNRFGNLLETLSKTVEIDTGSTVAVLNVESSGMGFAKDGRLIIRLENHKFWKYWGQHNSEAFHSHFKYRSDKVWRGHQFRPNENAEWEKMHVSQTHEWKVLDFARSLDDTAALKSISMGAPQIMGFHYKTIGYDSVQALFEKFNQDIRYQIFGLFDFFDEGMLAALKGRNFVGFAGGYNGSGKAEEYGSKIENQFNIFQRLNV